MIEKILLVILLIVYSLNYLNIIIINLNNEYFKENYNQCYILNNKSLYEIETYIHKLYRYIYNIDNKNFEDNINSYKITYKIVLLLLIILIILSIKDLYLNYKSKKIIIIILLIILLIIYKYIGNNIIKKYNNIKDDRYNINNNVNRYRLVYKILNSLLYLNENNNIKSEILKFSSNKIINRKTFDEYLEGNISSIYNISNKNEINYLKDLGYDKLDFIKYLNLNRISPFYFKEYFENIYIILDNEKFYIKNIQYNERINNLIKEGLIRSGEKIEDIDYLNYYIKNNNILYNKKNNDISEILNMNMYIYIYLIIYIVLLLTITHILYITINKNIYGILLFIIGLIFLMLLWLKLK